MQFGLIPTASSTTVSNAYAWDEVAPRIVAKENQTWDLFFLSTDMRDHLHKYKVQIRGTTSFVRVYETTKPNNSETKEKPLKGKNTHMQVGGFEFLTS